MNAQIAIFSVSQSSGCAPLSVTFTNNSTGATNYSWDFGNGNTAVDPTPPVGATYLNPGVYLVKLTASNSSTGNSNVATLTITVYAKPVANYTTNVTSTTCVGEPILFSDASTLGGGQINNWQWDFGDGSSLTTTVGSVSHSYNVMGTYPVSLIITDANGCSPSSVIHTITVLAAPIVSFSGNVLFSCFPPLSVNFTNSSSTTGPISYLWNFGDGTTSTLPNPTHNYATSGLFTVKLIIVQSACIDSLVKVNYVVINNILADFSVNNDSICAGQSVSFTDLSIPLTVSRTWDFGDGSTDTSPNPTHVYTTPGSYTVSLLNASASSGCADDTVKTNFITVLPSTLTAFTADATQSCSIPFTVNFTDNSVNATGWLWDFGDGTPTSIQQNPSHTYTAFGTYTVSLVTSNASGCSETVIKPNYIIISPPSAQFSATPLLGCVPLTVNFTNTSTSLVDPIVNYHWDFGDGTIIDTSGLLISNIYNSAGVFTVKLVITTAAGCKDSLILTNYIKAGTIPHPDFSVVDSTVCYGTLAMFNDLSTSPPADSVYYLFGDGANFSAHLPSTPVIHLYADTGIFDVTQIVYYNGCPDTLKYDSIVTVLPAIPKFTYQLNCLNYYTVNFDDASIGADSIAWDFGDGTFDFTNNLHPVHTFASRGTYTVRDTAYNSNGCFFFSSSTFTIAEPIARFTADTSGCYPLNDIISNLSQDSISFVWNFGDGSPNSFLGTPTHTYSLPGRDSLSLIITDINGCKDTASKIIKVLGPIPFNNASVLTGCAPLFVNFTDTSVDDSTLVKWSWNFGDGSPVQNLYSPSISHTYTAPGLYTVTMTVKDTNQCSQTLVKTDYIVPTFPWPAITAPDFACKGEAITFNASNTIAASATYLWDFGDGTNGVGQVTTHTYTSDNLYFIHLTVTDINGCDSTIKDSILIQKPIALFTNTILSEGCGFTNVKFTDISTGAIGWQWNFGDGATSTSQNPMHSYTQPGYYSVSLMVVNNAGCKDTLILDSIVVVPGPIGTFSINPIVGCSPLTVSLTAFSINATSYTWDFGDGSVITTTNPVILHTYLNDNIYHPILLLSNLLANGNVCQLAATTPSIDSVIVSTLMHININSTTVTLTQDQEYSITSAATNVLGSPVFSWTPADGLNCTTCQTPTIIGNGSGQNEMYYLTLTDPSSGTCKSTDSILIVFPLCENDLKIPNIFTPNDDGINDIFKINGICLKSNYLLQIYDRWGLKMFSAEVKNLAWDGRTISGMKAPEGVYYYVITIEGKRLTGFLQLTR